MRSAGRARSPSNGCAISSCRRTWSRRQVFAAGRGLHEADGVSLIPMSAKLDLRQGSDASILIFRRGSDRRRADRRQSEAQTDPAHRRAAATASTSRPPRRKGILVSCLPRRTLQYTAEHAILLMLALSKHLIEADDAVRKDRWDRDRVHPEHGVAYNWVGQPGLGGLFGKTIGIIGLGEVGSLAAGMARGFGARVVYSQSQPTAAGIRGAEARRRISAAGRPAGANPISCRCTPAICRRTRAWSAPILSRR